MGTYTFELTKIIVVEIEAKTLAEATKHAREDTDGFDGAWDRVENNVELIDMQEE